MNLLCVWILFQNASTHCCFRFLLFNTTQQELDSLGWPAGKPRQSWFGSEKKNQENKGKKEQRGQILFKITQQELDSLGWPAGKPRQSWWRTGRGPAPGPWRSAASVRGRGRRWSSARSQMESSPPATQNVFVVAAVVFLSFCLFVCLFVSYFLFLSWGCTSGRVQVPRMQWSLGTSWYLACQVRVTVGDSGLCCCACVTSIER